MNEQPEALRWAAILEHQAQYDGPTDYKHKAAAELRRLHAENERLREALWAAANKIQKLAFQISAPNVQTPEFMRLAVAIRQIIQEQPR